MPTISANVYFPPPPTAPFPKPRFPLKTPNSNRPSLGLLTNHAPPTIKMGFRSPQLGAMGVTYTAMRAMQFASLITVIGLVSYFINEITTASRAPPSELVGTLTVVCDTPLFLSPTDMQS